MILLGCLRNDSWLKSIGSMCFWQVGSSDGKCLKGKFDLNTGSVGRCLLSRHEQNCDWIISCLIQEKKEWAGGFTRIKFKWQKNWACSTSKNDHKWLKWTRVLAGTWLNEFSIIPIYKICNAFVFFIKISVIEVCRQNHTNIKSEFQYKVIQSCIIFYF